MANICPYTTEKAQRAGRLKNWFHSRICHMEAPLETSRDWYRRRPLCVWGVDYCINVTFGWDVDEFQSRFMCSHRSDSWDLQDAVLQMFSAFSQWPAVSKCPFSDIWLPLVVEAVHCQTGSLLEASLMHQTKLKQSYKCSMILIVLYFSRIYIRFFKKNKKNPEKLNTTPLFSNKKKC